MSKKIVSFTILTLLSFGIIVGAGIQSAHAALDTGLNIVTNTIQLGSQDPRTIIARVINTSMMFLGIIAVVIILIGGFKWMTSGGSEDKVGEAKKLMGAGVVGLVIVLASWGVAQFIVRQLSNSTGN